jgi:hypothetical protein
VYYCKLQGTLRSQVLIGSVDLSTISQHVTRKWCMDDRAFTELISIHRVQEEHVFLLAESFNDLGQTRVIKSTMYALQCIYLVIKL